MSEQPLHASDSADDAILCHEVLERELTDTGERYSIDEVFGQDYRPAEDGFIPEFE